MSKNFSQNKEIARAMFLYISYSILGPLLIIGGLGYFVDKIFKTKFFLLFSIFIAYIISNILMFKKLKKLNKELDKIKVEKKDENVIISETDSAINKYDDDDEYNEKWPVKQVQSTPESDLEKNKN